MIPALGSVSGTLDSLPGVYSVRLGQSQNYLPAKSQNQTHTKEKKEEEEDEDEEEGRKKRGREEEEEKEGREGRGGQVCLLYNHLKKKL